jgi:tyrosine-protein kinase Etk/Wzc
METSQMEQRFSPVANALEAAPRETTEIDLLDLLIVLARRKKLIVWATVGSAVIAAIISLLIPNRYTATATILPPQQTQSTATMLMNQLAGSGLGSLAAMAGGGLGLKNPNDLYIGMLKSHTVEDRLIQQFGFQHIYSDKRLSDTRNDLEKYSDISSGKDGMIAISFEDKDPKRAAAVANSYVDELRDLTQHLAVTEASQRRLFFEEQVQQAKDDLANAEIALKDTQQKTGMIQLDSQAKAVIEAIGTLRGQIAAKEVQLQAMRSFATDQNPDYVVAEQQLAGLQAQLGKLEKQQPSDSSDPLMATSKVPGVALEYVRRVREVKYREAVFEALAKQYEAAKLDEAKEAAIIQVVDPATPPDRKSSPKRMLIVLAGGLLGLVIALFYVFGSEALQYVQKDHVQTARLNLLVMSLRGKRHPSDGALSSGL